MYNIMEMEDKTLRMVAALEDLRAYYRFVLEHDLETIFFPNALPDYINTLDAMKVDIKTYRDFNLNEIED